MPNRAALYNSAFEAFARGDLDEAFYGMHQRSIIPGFRPEPLRTLPAWDGAPDQNVFVWAPEGIGIGAEVLHLGFLPAIATARPGLTVACDARLVGRLSAAQRAVRFVPRGAPVPEGMHAQVCILSLGHVARRLRLPHPRAGRILGASSAAVAALRGRLSPDGRPLVGVSWATTNTRWAGARDLPLNKIAAMAAWGPRLVSLQHGASPNSLDFLGAAGVHHEDGFDPAADVQGLIDRIAAMDAVVSIDNSVAFLSGALGRCTQVVLGPAHSWPWHAPKHFWYKNLDVVRHSVVDGWEPVLARLRSSLAAMI